MRLPCAGLSGPPIRTPGAAHLPVAALLASGRQALPPALADEVLGEFAWWPGTCVSSVPV